MDLSWRRAAIAAGGFLAALAFAIERPRAAEDSPIDRTQARQLVTDGNYQEALAALQTLTLTPRPGDSRDAAEDFRQALSCFQQLNRVSELDEYRETLVKVRAKDWIVLAAIARSYLEIPHQGFLIAGKFERGNHRGGGEVAHATARDRVRALQLYLQALAYVKADAETRGTADATALLDGFIAAVMDSRIGSQAWKLQTLTDLGTLPDYEQGWGYYGETAGGAAVDEGGKPVFYETPASWDAAKNDGERWRSLLTTRREWTGDKVRELMDRADFLESQFGVQTMADYGWWFARQDEGSGDSNKSQYLLDKLGEDETIARLAVGIKRFKLPDDQNPIRLYQEAIEESQGGSDSWRRAASSLAGIFENRRQYPRAADYWRKLIGSGGAELPTYLLRLEQITGNWGRFESTVTQPAGRGATLQYRFRNGKRVEFTARPVKLRALLDDVKKRLAGDPEKLDWNEIKIDNLGYRLVVEGQEKYLEKEAARWTLDLEPRPGHLDRRVEVTTPLQKAGAYLVTARMEGGNTHNVVVWLADAGIVKKPLAGRALYYVADAVTGKPLPKCNVEFFGYRQEPDQSRPNRYRVTTKNFAELTDQAGMITLSADDANRQYNWLAIASTPGGGVAYLGFRGVWAGDYYDEEYKQLKVFTITDRPVYRPGQEVHFKFWVASAQYDAPEASAFAGQSFVVEITDGRGEKVFTQTLVADAYGGLAGDWKLPADATLGMYQLNVVNHGGGSFRVEEYKKPEFEVKVEAPEKPVMLGDKITAKISAKYYFGSPVTNAKVKYKVLRTPHEFQLYPVGPWDWLYGNGYAWLADDYTWYPGWGRWGCVRPWPWWFWRQPTPPEVVAERETTVGPDGTVDVEIDTAPAKEFHGDQDHAYQIQVEVTDQSRRTIVADGRVLVARQPFKVTVWTHRGYYNAGDTIEVSGAAQTIDGKPVTGAGTLRLLRIAYENDKPVENEVARWDLPPNAQGNATIQIKASEPGQYRLSYEVTQSDKANGAGAAKGRTIEGGQVVVVRGDKFDGGEFRFNDVEVTPDKREYAPGEKVKLQVSANRAGATVLLFLRPANGIYLPPQAISLQGKSAVVEVDVSAKDMPNFFVEAVAVHSGGVHSAVREIFVPPAERVFNIDVEPSAAEYLPGEHATVKFKLTGSDGKPVVGSTVAAIYDRALDYIAGGAGTTDIRKFFWEWRRSHREQGETNLDRTGYPVVKAGTREMENLGVFGEGGADFDGANGQVAFDRRGEGRGGYGGGGAMFKGGARLGLAAAAPMAMAESAADGRAGGGRGGYGGAAPGEGAPVEPVVRQNFADTALWVGALETNAEGVGELQLDMPENLSAWKINVWGMGRGTRVGQGSAEVVTRKNIIVRLQAPRFFVERDEVVLSAIVHNYLKEAKQVEVKLDLMGNTLGGPAEMSKTVEITAGGEQRVDWRVKALREGEATIRMSALTDVESDAMQMTFPVLVHGMLKTESFSGAIRPTDSSGKVTFTVPHERRAEQTRLEVRYTPTLAGAMVDALPYLADYPYGCTEQTLNRFLPAVLTQRTLKKMGVDLAEIQKKRTNLNAQEIGDGAERAAQWKRFDRNPVFDEAELNTIVKAGVNRLTEMQLSDGGWGWFTGWGEESSAHTTATVVRGLLVAKENEVALVPGVVEKGVAWLEQYQAAQLAALDNWDRDASKARDKDRPAKSNVDDLDALVYLVLVEAKRAGVVSSGDSDEAGDVAEAPNASQAMTRMRDYLFKDRTKLAVYSLATFGLALQEGGNAEQLPMVMRNLSQYVRQDDENQTAWLDLPAGYWWYWYGSEYEAHAYYLKLLAATEPKSEVAPRMVKYLLNNRKHATYWNSTRDTALVVEAFADYLAASGESKPNLTVEVILDGKVVKSVAITPEDLFTFDNKFVVEGAELADGDHTVELRKKGEGPLYFNAYLTNFTLEDPLKAAGLEIKVERRYFKLTAAEKHDVVAGERGQAISQRGEKYERTPLVNLAELTSGDLVEVELLVDSKNDYEYILLEDMKPAGFEAVDLRSGYTGNALGAYVEFRDQRVALFARTLARGQHSVSYRLRAEIPGKFSALPTKASAMYAPELKANSDELKLQVVD